jgi:hypothetical protein
MITTRTNETELTGMAQQLIREYLILLAQNNRTKRDWLWSDIELIEIVELVVPGWLLRVQLVMTPYRHNLCCHAHLQGPTATTDSAFLWGSSWEETVLVALDYSEYWSSLLLWSPTPSRYPSNWQLCPSAFCISRYGHRHPGDLCPYHKIKVV